MNFPLKQIFFILLVLFLYHQILRFKFTKSQPYYFSTNEIEKFISFDQSNDLLVFIHIQKTSGKYFDYKVMKYLMIFDLKIKKWNYACRKKENRETNMSQDKNPIDNFYCPRKDNTVYKTKFEDNWFFSRLTYGWQCGVHPDYTRLNSCLNSYRNKNKFRGNIYYITMLRNPINRYLSEWYQVTWDDNPWHTSINVCNKETLFVCLPNKRTKQITLEDFMSCESGIANNRQTRLLANYNEKNHNCSLFQQENKRQLLENAKNVLKTLSYFALTEYEKESEELFEYTFGNKFKFALKSNSSLIETNEFKILKSLNKTTIERIKQLNDLDLELYNFSKDLFFKRLKHYRLNQPIK